MKKNLFTCFLALLCLAGSPSSAQSRVADSPGADFLHRSGLSVSPHSGDTHRGGETLSDTFQKGTPHEIDGGPWSVSLSNPWTAVCDLETANWNLHTANCKPPGFSLVDDSTSPGQEGGISSAQAGKGATQGIPAVILVEIMSVSPIDSLEFRIWDPYLNELDIPKPYIEFATLTPGSVFDGSWGGKKVQWTSPDLSGNARVSIRNGRFKYLDRFLVQPGDSVRIRFDFQTARVMFSGPAADKFRSQYELAQAIESDLFGQNPIMFTGKSNYWGNSEEDSIRIAKAKASSSSIRPMIQFVSPDQTGFEFLKQGLSRDLNNHRAWEIINNYQDRLPTDFWLILKADMQGKIRYEQIRYFLYLRLGLENTQSYRQLYLDKIKNNNPEIPDGAEWSVYYIDYLYQKLLTISHMEKEPMVNFLSSIPERVRDPVYAKYLIKKFRTFEDSNAKFEEALAIIQTPWISELISSLYHSQRIGAPLASIPLTTLEGDSTFLKADDGKVRFIQFWLPGCQASERNYKRLLSPVIAHFKDDPQVEFVFISNDQIHERWLENVAAETYSSQEAINLNAPGRTHPFLMYYHIHAFPEQMVIDSDGGVANLGDIPKAPQALIEYLNSLKESEPSTTQPLQK